MIDDAKKKRFAATETSIEIVTPAPAKPPDASDVKERAKPKPPPK